MVVLSINQVDLQPQNHGYARSLARFAANLGPVVWRVASKKIRSVLPSGTNFGPGWVGEHEMLEPSRFPFSQKQNAHSSSYEHPSSASSSMGLNLVVEDVESARRLASQSKLTSPSNSTGDANSLSQANMNCSGVMVGTAMQNMPSLIPTSYEAAMHPEAPAMASSSYRTNQAIPAKYIKSNNLSQGSSGLQPFNSFRSNAPPSEELAWNWPVHQVEYKTDRCPNPLDSNARFRVQGSPSSGLLISSQQPDLGLQL